MSAPADPLVVRLAAALDTPDGHDAVARAVRAVLRHDGAPTRPGGRSRPLGERWDEGEPLAEDTDWQAPLGPFRDPHVVRGTLGELAAARLSAGGFAGDLLLALLVPFARAAGSDLLAGAVDEADSDDRCHSALARVVAGWAERPLAVAGRLPERLPGRAGGR